MLYTAPVLAQQFSHVLTYICAPLQVCTYLYTIIPSSCYSQVASIANIARQTAWNECVRRRGLGCFAKYTHAKLFFYLLTGKPSRVIHIRNIPNESSDTEIIHLGIPFGRVTNVLVLKGKNQAFLEMADESAATNMVALFNANPPTIRGRTVYVQFSNHRELKTDQNNTNTVSAKMVVKMTKNH